MQPLSLRALGILIVLGFIFFTMLSFNSLVASIPQYQDELNNRINDINTLLESYNISIATDGQPSIKLGDIMQYGYTGFMSILEAVEFLFFVGIMTFFMLLDCPAPCALVEERLGRNSETARQMNQLIGYVTDFIVVRTETNFIHGLLFGGFLGIIGVHGAILWGVLTFLLGYIPYIGLLIAAIPAIFFAWLQFGIPGALAVIVVGRDPEPAGGKPDLLLPCRTEIRDAGPDRDHLGHLLGMAAGACRHALFHPVHAPPAPGLRDGGGTALDQCGSGCQPSL